MRKKLNSFIFPGIIVLFSIIPLLDLLHPGLPITHDGQDHVARIANFYKNLQDGMIIPRWAPNLNWGYGHPVLNFLYPLSSYTASFFHLFSFSFVDSVKLVFAFGFILSGLSMFMWLKEFLPRHAALIGSLLYLFAPYRFVDIYVRGAIGEHMAFVFPPLILYFLLKLAKKYSASRLVLGAFSFAGLILAHNAISIMFIPLIFFYALFLMPQVKSKQRFAVNFLLIFIFGFALSAFFWVPAFFEGKYTLRDLVTKDGFINNFASFPRFIYSPWSYGISGQFSLQVGILHWVAVLLSLPITFSLLKKKNKLWILSAGLLVVFVSSLFIMERSSQVIWEKVSLIQKFQFPWRFLSVTVFSSSVLCAIIFSFIRRRYIIVLTGIFIVLILFLNKDYWQAQGYLNKPESYYTGVYDGTTDTGESAPVWSVRFMERRPKAHADVIGGRAEIKEVKRSSAFHEYLIKVASPAQIRENTLYFPGWEISVDDKPVNIEFQDENSRGIMTFLLKKGVHDVKVVFGETKLRFIADIISASSILIVIIFSLIKFDFYQRRKNHS